MSAPFETARTLLVTEAVHAWKALTIAQRSALRRCLTDLYDDDDAVEMQWLRVQVRTHARTQDALRRAGILVSLDSDRGKRDLTDMGAFIRSTGLAWERSRTRKAAKGLRR